MSLVLNLLFETDSYSNEYLIAKFGFDTAENEPLKVCLILPYLPRPEIEFSHRYHAPAAASVAGAALLRAGACSYGG